MEFEFERFGAANKAALFHAAPIRHYNEFMSEPLVMRKELIMKEDGRTVILYSFEHVLESPQSEMGREGEASAHETASDKSSEDTAHT